MLEILVDLTISIIEHLHISIHNLNDEDLYIELQISKIEMMEVNNVQLKIPINTSIEIHVCDYK